MLTHLLIKNIALMESAEIGFGTGLNILTGETGAGKTALMHGLALALGHKASSSVLRKGADKALVEATFEVATASPLFPLLEREGIDHAPGGPLVLRREMNSEGRSRAFINDCLTPLSLLQEISFYLIDLIDQSSSQKLKNGETQRFYLDLYAGAQDALTAFSSAWEEEKALKERHETLLTDKEKKEKEQHFLTQQLQELEEANLQENEEELAIQEHSRLASCHTLIEKVDQIQEIPSSVMGHLAKLRQAFSSLTALDPKLQELPPLLEEATIPLKEIEERLSSYLSKLEADPKRFDYLEERLGLIHHLKKKWSVATFPELKNYQTQLQKKLAHFEDLDQELETCQAQLLEAEKRTHACAASLTALRKKGAAQLAATIEEHLKSLNMSARFSIEITPQGRSSTGDDLITFWMQTNVGETPLPVKNCASGGELSRLLFALICTLAAKNQTPTLVFDEIDANVGGETATLMGEKLRTLGKARQLICVTHFPQVACQADHHFRIHKEESEGRTLTHLEPLSKKEREKELLRMLGGKKLVTS